MDSGSECVSELVSRPLFYHPHVWRTSGSSPRADACLDPTPQMSQITKLVTTASNQLDLESLDWVDAAIRAEATIE